MTEVACTVLLPADAGCYRVRGRSGAVAADDPLGRHVDAAGVTAIHRSDEKADRRRPVFAPYLYQ
jgi:hypothetical protein